MPEAEQPRSRKLVLWLVLAVLVLGVLGGGALLQSAMAPEVAAKGPPPPAPVVVEKVQPPPLRAAERYFAEFRAVTDAALTVGEGGRVRKVHVREGDRVKKGDLLLELDADLAVAEARRVKADKEQAEARLAQTQRDAVRFKALGRASVVGTAETERRVSEAEVAQAERESRQADLRVSRERIQRHRIVAPFPGVISRREVDPGDWLDAGQAALSLVTDDRAEVFTRVPPDFLERAKPLAKTPAKVVKGEQSIPLELVGMVGALDPASRTALIRLRPTREASWLRPGDTADVEFLVQHRDGLVVSQDALVYGVVGARVIKVVDGKAEPVDIKVLATAGNRSLVQGKGLAVGDQIVARGNERLRPGQALKVEQAKP